MSENNQENKEIKFIVAPEWGEEFGNAIQILKKEFSDLGDSEFTFVDEKDSNQAKVETKLGESHILATSCLGKNELKNCLVFKLFITASGEGVQAHKKDSSLDIQLDKDGKIITSLIFRNLGVALTKLLREFNEGEVKSVDSNSEDKKSSGTES